MNKEKTFLRAALEYLAKNQIELNYTFPALYACKNGDERFPESAELDEFLEKRPYFEDLFLLTPEWNNGYYDRDCGAYLYDFVVFDDDGGEEIDALEKKIEADEDLYDEFLRTLCYDDNGTLRGFIVDKTNKGDLSKSVVEFIKEGNETGFYALCDDFVVMLNDKGFFYHKQP